MNIKTAVLGVGSLGQHHARVLANHPNSLLTAIVDVDTKRGEKIAKLYNAQSHSDYKSVIGKIQAAVISVPTPFHFKIAKELMEAGIHCLVEKPFTSTVEEAQELISISIEKKLLLQVGLIERFNPAVIAARPFIHSPKFIEVNRLGPYDPRTSHIGVVLDLMIHDLDILLALMNDKVVSLEAFGAKVLSDHEDIVKARLKFSNGCIADLSASRVSLEKYRKIRVFQNDSYISVDYANKSLKVYRKKSDVIKSFNDIEIIKPKLKDEEMLYKELDHFLTCVIEGKKTMVSGEHGRDALELAHEILKNMKL
ncbi:MAG: Gfo/Idh/MocA family oxidoreductase [Elusimicrobia bacterium]|nr:Gfo/Idh/MocA family oxidoreductase [Candidatus Liberimonas magnetica]